MLFNRNRDDSVAESSSVLDKQKEDDSGNDYRMTESRATGRPPTSHASQLNRRQSLPAVSIT